MKQNMLKIELLKQNIKVPCAKTSATLIIYCQTLNACIFNVVYLAFRRPWAWNHANLVDLVRFTDKKLCKTVFISLPVPNKALNQNMPFCAIFSTIENSHRKKRIGTNTVSGNAHPVLLGNLLQQLQTTADKLFKLQLTWGVPLFNLPGSFKTRSNLISFVHRKFN